MAHHSFEGEAGQTAREVARRSGCRARSQGHARGRRAAILSGAQTPERWPFVGHLLTELRMRLVASCAFSCLCFGCLGRGQDAHEPGDRLGTYHATGALTTDSCKAPLLGVTPEWQFDVKLSRDGDTLYWLNGQEAIPGSIARDGKTFDFQSGVQVTLAAARSDQLGCVIDRSDVASGKLSSSTADVPSFSIDMSFGYAAENGSECAGLVGVEGGFEALPCQVRYMLTGERTASPAEQ